LATDLKTVPMEMVQKRLLRTGDGSHDHAKSHMNTKSEATNERDIEHFWGWNDETLTEEDKEGMTIINKTN